MRKYILGAGAALAVAAGDGIAQSPAKPAPVVPATPSDTFGLTPAQMVAPSTPIQGLPATTAPIVGLGDAAPVASAGPIDGLFSGPSAAQSAPRMYAEGSFLLMFVSADQISIPIATAGPSLGIIGLNGTTTLLGNNSVSYQSIPGVKVAVGGWLGDSSLGVEAIGFYLNPSSDSTSLGPTGSTLLARPFFNTTTKSQSSQIFAASNAFNGGMTFDENIQLWGFEVNPFWRIASANGITLDMLTGFRFLQAQERLNIYTGTNILPGGTAVVNGIDVAAGSDILVQDRFGAVNNFYGGNIGGRLGFGGNGLFLDITGKVAIGAVQQTVNVQGATTVTTNGALTGPGSSPGGFLTAAGNLGRRSDTRFAVLPEGNIQMGYQFTSWLNAFAGYSVMYLSSMGRPGGQLNNDFPATSLPTSPQYNPNFTQRTTQVIADDLWIHGFNFGVTLTY